MPLTSGVSARVPSTQSVFAMVLLPGPLAHLWRPEPCCTRQSRRRAGKTDEFSWSFRGRYSGTRQARHSNRVSSTARIRAWPQQTLTGERLQTELLHAQKMEALGQLISGVAHELNNPLAAIIAFSQLIRSDQRLRPIWSTMPTSLVRDAERTRRIVQNLLEFARQRTPDRRPTQLTSACRANDRAEHIRATGGPDRCRHAAAWRPSFGSG